MQRIWVVVLSVWAMLAIVAVLAWSSRPSAASARCVGADRDREGPRRKAAARRSEDAGARDDRDVGGGARMSRSPSHRVARRRHDLRRRSDRRTRRTSARSRGRSPPPRTRSPPASASSPVSIPASDLSRLNDAGGRWMPVGRRLLEALGLALRAREDTGGRFDPTVLPGARGRRLRPLLRAARGAAGRGTRMAGARARRSSSTNGTAARGSSRARPSTSAVSARATPPAAPSTRCCAASPTLAGGGLVDLGGDIVVSGESPEGGPWLVAVADPRRAGETLAVLALEGGGVATSGRDARRFGPARSLHHLIDPETGESALGGPLTVTVVAPDPVAAEVNATTLAIAGPGEAEATLPRGRHLGALRPARRTGDPARPAAARDRAPGRAGRA